VYVHFWVFNSIALIFLPVFIPIPCSFYHYFSVVQLEVRDGDFPYNSFIVENNFHYLQVPDDWKSRGSQESTGMTTKEREPVETISRG
jgi:hypothetical protein